MEYLYGSILFYEFFTEILPNEWVECWLLSRSVQAQFRWVVWWGADEPCRMDGLYGNILFCDLLQKFPQRAGRLL
jgi:hypothetical protein